MAGDERWYFTKEQLANTPSRKNGIDADKELSYRQQAANLIQDMGQRLQVTQLCINTAIVYMHRFFMFHSMTLFHRNQIALAALFLAAKVEEQPRKLEHLIRIGHLCLHRTDVKINTTSESYLEQAQDIVCHENILLQTLGFDVAIDHPHTHVVRCCQLVKACKDLAQTSYFMASNSLHLTMMCLQYKPTVVACFCIHLACRWACWVIPESNEGRPWHYYVDPTVKVQDLEAMTAEFLQVFDKCPSKLQKRIMSMSKNSTSPSRPLTNSPFDSEPRKVQPDPLLAGSSGHLSLPALAAASREKEEKLKAAFNSGSVPGRPNEARDYREKKDREKPGMNFPHHSSSHSSSHPSSHMHKPGMPAQKHQSSNPKNALYSHPHAKPDLNKPPQGVPQRPHNNSAVSRDPNQRQKPRDYHMPTTQNQHGLSSLENSVLNHLTNVENKHQMHDKRHGELWYKQLMMNKFDYRKDRKIMEDVHKVEKVPPQKPREEQMKEEYMSHMLKQSQRPNYNQDKGPPTMPNPTHGVSKIFKDPVKNGNNPSASSFSLNGAMEDGNRLHLGRPEEQKPTHPPQPSRQRSLFSPESNVKPEAPRQPLYNRQKTPPKVVEKVPKSTPVEYHTLPQPNHQEKKILPPEMPKLNLGLPESDVKMENFNVKMEQPFRNESISTMMNGRPFKIEPKEEPKSQCDPTKFNPMSFEEMNMNMFQKEIKQEIKQEVKKEELPSPLKATNSIKALLQEAILAPSTLISKSTLASVPTPSVAPVTVPVNDDLRQILDPLVPAPTTFTNLQPIPNTQSTVPTVFEVASVPADPVQNTLDLLSPQSDDKKEHKSEKKKKDKKHKHKEKDKDKSKKEKHKHRHKEKDRESKKNKDKDVPVAAPIKIKIPKDKISLGADMDMGTSLKIKIPKERIKPPQGSLAPLGSPPGVAVQAPLKIKIRTSEIPPIHEVSSRKRDRDRSEDDPSAIHATKRPTVQPVGGAAYASQLQNGRHYSSSSNNKVRGGQEQGFAIQEPASSSYSYDSYSQLPPHSLYETYNQEYMYDSSLSYQSCNDFSYLQPQYMYSNHYNGAVDTTVPPPMMANWSAPKFQEYFLGNPMQSLPKEPMPIIPPPPRGDCV